MRPLRIVYWIALVLSVIGFVDMLMMLIGHISSSDRQVLETVSQGFVVLVLATMIAGLSHVLYTRGIHIDRRFYVVFLVFVAVRLLIELVLL